MNKNLLLSLFAALLVVLVGPMRAVGQINTGALPASLTQNFNSLSSTGPVTWTNNTTPLVGWYSTTTTLNPNTGSTNSNNVYNFGTASASDRALGGLSNATTHRFGMRIKNNSGSAVTSVTVSFTGEMWRINNAHSLTFDYQVGTTVTSITAGTWTAVTNLDFAAPSSGTAAAVDGNNASYRTAISHTFSVAIPAGSEIMLRWNKAATNSPGLAIDDLTVGLSASSTPTVNLSSDVTTGTEAATTYVKLTATASAAVTGDQTVDVSYTGTGITDGDFRRDADGPGPSAPVAITFPYTVTIPDGQTSVDLYLMVYNDATYECTETATFAIGSPTSGITIGSTSTQDFAITDNDFPTVNLSTNNTTGSEASATSITLTATASAAVIGAQTVSVALTGTGLANADFSGITFPATITIADGATTGTRTFTINDDAAYEGTENATFTISSPSSCVALGATTTAALAITDNDLPAVNLSVSANAGSEAGTTVITVTATASAVISGEETVDIAVTGTGITTGDYTLSAGIITINGSATGTVTFTIVDDAVYECAETATLTISNPSTGIVLGATTTRTVAITDNDFPTINLSINTATSSEAATTSITLTATASAAVIGAQTVSVALTGTGLANADFSGVTFPATITIANGATTGTATFTIVDDASIEGDESATFTISSPSSCAALGATTTQGLSIVENDFPAAPCAELFISEYLEGSGTTNKYIEIYNPTASAIDLAAGVYSLRLYSNGAGTPSQSSNLTGSIGAYQTKVYKNGGTLYAGTATTDATVINFNGDDAVALAKNGVNIDIFGRIGDDPGTQWTGGGNSSLDKTLVRNASVEVGVDVNPTGTGPTAFTTIGTEWTQGNIDVVSNLGSHTCDCFVNLPVVTLTTNFTAGTEAAATAFVLTATADVAVTGNQTVRVVLSGTGLTASDFTGPDFTGTVNITILSGATTGTLNIAVNDDAAVESTETATFTIGTPSAGVVIGTPAAVNFTITDNDNVVSSLSVIDGIGNEAASISSLTNGTITTSAQGTEVWQFRLYDGNGISNDVDTKPTVYQQWVFRPGTGNTVPDWDAAINNIKFFLNGSGTPIPGAFLVNAASISFLPSTPITVADGGSALISMRITLENTLPAASDGKRFVFKVVDADVTVDTDVLNYSQLASFSEESSATLNGIDILATLQFINAPTAVSVGSNFSVTVSAVDANGNVDTGVSNSITLSLTSGTGTLTGAPVTVNLTSGTHIFTGLNHDTEEVITITVHDNGNVFANLTANINVTNEPHQLFDDFNRADNAAIGIPSSGGSTSWSEIETGGSDGSKIRIVGNMLTLNNCVLSDPSGSSGTNNTVTLSFDMSAYHATTYNNADGTLNWLFNIQTTRANPSGFTGSGYGYGFVLGSTLADPMDPSAKGYAVIGGDASNDYLKIVYFTNGLVGTVGTQIVDVATTNIAPSTNYASVKVSFDPCTGLWSINARNDGSSAFTAPILTTPAYSATGTGTNTTNTGLNLKYMGAVWKHNSSCTETLRLDNISVPNASTAPTSTKLWNGSISADWNVAGNWGPCPGVPTNADNVIIPNVVTQPIISAASPAATCKDLTVNAGADLTINASRFLNVWGNVVNNGSTAFGAGTLTMEGPGTLTLTGNVNVANYHVSTNVTLNGTVTISDIARSEVGGVLAANGNLVLLNGAQLLHGTGTTNGGGSVSGNIVVKRQGNSSGGFNGWSTPVVGGALPGSNGYSYNSALGTNSNADDNNPLPDPGWAAHSGAMTAGKGYFSQNGGLATFTGVANNASYTPAVTGSAQALSSIVAPTFFNLIGNPYPSAISANQFINDNSARIDGTIYFWADENAGPTAYSQNDYATYTLNGGVPTVAGGNGPVPNGSIPSCQGFFVNCISSGNINFNNGQRGGDNSQFFRMAAPDAQRLWLSINNSNLQLFNQTLVAFDEFATDQKDWGMDAYKLRGNQEISIGAQQDGETYVIATYEAIPQSGKIVPLMTYAETAGTYTFAADSMSGFENHTVYLEDLSNGSLYPLEQGDSYSFAMTSADEFNRFQLWFSPLTITGVDEVANDLRIYATNDMVVVEQTSGESVKGIVQITDMAGRMVLNNDLTITNGIGRLQTANLANGIYAVSFVSLNGNWSIAQKVTLGQ